MSSQPHGSHDNSPGPWKEAARMELSVISLRCTSVQLIMLREARKGLHEIRTLPLLCFIFTPLALIIFVCLFPWAFFSSFFVFLFINFILHIILLIRIIYHMLEIERDWMVQVEKFKNNLTAIK